MATKLALKLRSLADQGVFIGTSSWKYPGWMGDVYTQSRYETRVGVFVMIIRDLRQDHRELGGGRSRVDPLMGEDGL